MSRPTAQQLVDSSHERLKGHIDAVHRDVTSCASRLESLGDNLQAANRNTAVLSERTLGLAADAKKARERADATETVLGRIDRALSELRSRADVLERRVAELEAEPVSEGFSAERKWSILILLGGSLFAIAYFLFVVGHVHP